MNRVAARHEPRSGPPDKLRSQSEPSSQSAKVHLSPPFHFMHSVSYKAHLISSKLKRQVSTIHDDDDDDDNDNDNDDDNDDE